MWKPAYLFLDCKKCNCTSVSHAMIAHYTALHCMCLHLVQICLHFKRVLIPFTAKTTGGKSSRRCGKYYDVSASILIWSDLEALCVLYSAYHAMYTIHCSLFAL